MLCIGIVYRSLNFIFLQVTLLESRSRLGGRVHTDYSFGCPVDMGASWCIYFIVLNYCYFILIHVIYLIMVLCMSYASVWSYACHIPQYGLMRALISLSFRLHGVCNENPLAPFIRALSLRLYRTSGDNSVLYDHDLER